MLRRIEQFNTFSVLDDEARNRNVRQNCAKITKRLDRAQAHDTKAILTCFGPSLKETWPQIAMDAMSARVFTVSGAHQFLINHHITPFAHIDCDPRAYKAGQMGEPNEDVQYWIASCVDPAFLKLLDHQDVALWHLWNSDESATVLDEVEPKWWAVQGGACVGLRALALLYALGYRDFEIHGMDCSQAQDATHAGIHFGKFQANIDVKCGDRWFKTTGALASYATQFMELREKLPEIRLNLHGDGLLQHMCRLRGEAT